jgi:hypothetical protein
MNRLKFAVPSVLFLIAVVSGARAQSTNTNLVAATIVGMPPAELVRLITPLVVETGVTTTWIGANTNPTVTIERAKIGTFTIERDYSPSKPEWRQWINDDGGGQLRNAALAFLASPGNVINTLEFLDCVPQNYAVGPGTNGVVVERLTIQPTALPP